MMTEIATLNIQGLIETMAGFIKSYTAKSDFSDALKAFVNKQYQKLSYTKTINSRNQPVDFLRNYMPLTIEHDNYRTNFEDPKFVFSQFPKVLIQGNAGAGKTSLLKYIYMRCVESKFKIPIFIELRKYSGGLLRFEDFILEEVDSIRSGLLIEAFHTGNFVFIFDGFDELSFDLSREFLTEVDRFIDRYSNNNYVISTRYGTDIENLTRFYNFRVLSLRRRDIVYFIQRMVVPKTVKQLVLEQLETVAEDDEKNAVLSNPLMLSLYVLTVEVYGRIPYKTANFYQAILDYLFSKHDSLTKAGLVRERMSGLNRSELETVVSALAFRCFATGRFQITRDQINRELEFAKQFIKKGFNSEQVLYDLTVTVNVLVQEGFVYNFIGYSLVEYLAAVFISAKSNRTSELLRKMVDSSTVNVSLNFMEVYSELDYKNLTLYYVIPSLESIYRSYRANAIQNSGPNENRLQYVHYINVLNLLVYLGMLSKADKADFTWSNYTSDADSKRNKLLHEIIEHVIPMKIKKLKEDYSPKENHDLDAWFD